MKLELRDKDGKWLRTLYNTQELILALESGTVRLHEGDILTVFQSYDSMPQSEVDASEYIEDEASNDEKLALK